MAQSRMIAKNTFGEGLIMDFAPDNTQANVLTNALNATMLTYNGNEMSLQNDMGNGQVETASLPEGYVPMGVCEFGGIIYIVSYNPQDNLCQIGSFPSPERNITKDDIPDDAMQPAPLENFQFQEGEAGNPNGKLKTLVSKVIIREDALNPGDKYIIESNRPSYTLEDLKSLTGLQDDNKAKKLKLSVVSIEDSGKITKLDTLNHDVSTAEGTKAFHILNSKTISNAMGTDINAYRKNLKQNFNVFSSRVPGKLAILAELEVITTFSCGHRVVTKTKKIGQDEYTTYDVYLDYRWESNDPTVNPMYITLTDFTWEPLLKDGSYAKYYNDQEKEVTLNIDSTYSTSGKKEATSSIINNCACIELPKLVDGNTSYFYHTLTSKTWKVDGIEVTVEESNYRKAYYDNNHRKNLAFYIKRGDQQILETCIEGKDIGEIELNNNFGLSSTTYLCSLTVPSRFDSYIFRLPYKLQYEVTPAMSFGLLEHLAVSNEIDFSLIGTKVIQPTGFKYFASQDLVTINIDSDIYEEENHKVTEMALEFYDVNGFCGSYFFEDRESYSGNLVANIPFNSEYLKKYKQEDKKSQDPYYHNIFENIDLADKKNRKLDTKAESTGDCGILYSNMLYGVKLLYEYSTLNPLTQEVEDSEIIEKGYWLFTNGQFNDYYYSVDNYSSIQFEIPLIYSYKMVDETSKKDIKLTDDTEGLLTELLNADSSTIDGYNTEKTGKYSLTTLASYSGDISLDVNVGIPEGSIFALISQEENLGPIVNLKLLSPNNDNTPFYIIKKKKEKEQNTSENEKETNGAPEIFTKYNKDSAKFGFESDNNPIKLSGEFSASTKITMEIPEIQFTTIPTQYKKQLIKTNILTPILYKEENDPNNSEAYYNFEDVGGQEMFTTSLCYAGSDDKESDSSTSNSDDGWYSTSIDTGTFSTYDSLLHEYEKGTIHTNILDGHESLISYYSGLGNRQPFTLFTIQKLEADSGYQDNSKYSGYCTKWTHNIAGPGNIWTIEGKHNDFTSNFPKDVTSCKIIAQSSNIASDFTPDPKDRCYLPAFVTPRIANGGYGVYMSSSGGNSEIIKPNNKDDRKCIPYTAWTTSKLKGLFYPKYLKTMKQLLTVNPELNTCEVGVFEYDQEKCDNLQLISVITAKLENCKQFKDSAPKIVAIHGLKYSKYIEKLLERMKSKVLKSSDNNVNVKFDLASLGEDQEVALTYINYNILHEHSLLDEFLDFGNTTVVQYLNGYWNVDRDCYTEGWDNKIYKSDIKIHDQKFYMAYAPSGKNTIKIKQITPGTHETNNKGDITLLTQGKQDPSPIVTRIKYSYDGNPIFYHTNMSINDFIWDVNNNKHHFQFVKESKLAIVESSYSYQLDDDFGDGKENKTIRPYYIGPSFISKLS